MAKFTLGALDRDMPTTLDVSLWMVTNTATAGTAAAPDASGNPLRNFRTDRINFTGTNLAFDGVSKASGFIDTMSYKAYGGQGFYERFSITDMKIA